MEEKYWEVASLIHYSTCTYFNSDRQQQTNKTTTTEQALKTTLETTENFVVIEPGAKLIHNESGVK